MQGETLKFVYCRVHIILPLVRIMNHINRVPAFPFHKFKINFNIILPSTSGSLKCILSFEFLHQTSVCISLVPMRAACPVHLNFLDLTTPYRIHENLQ